MDKDIIEVKKMYEEAVNIHDRYQFEVKLGYPLHQDQEQTSYLVSMYLFIPESLGIRQTTYTKEDFYRDMQSHIRLKTPSIPLAGLVKESDSPYARLAASLHALSGNSNTEALKNCGYLIKMFCCIFKSALRDHIISFDSYCNRCESEPFIKIYIETMKDVISSYRLLPSDIDIRNISEELFHIYNWGDEYISLLTTSYAYELLEALRKSGYQEEHPCRASLLSFIREEMGYCHDNRFKSCPDNHSANETFFYRKSMLKKSMESALYLDTSIKPEGAILEHLIFGVAAGLAMLFATVVTFFVQYVYGTITLQVFLIIIISYMFKDRIKELLKAYFSGKLHNKLYDHKIEIFDGINEKIGTLEESFVFVKADHVPPDIMRMRNEDHKGDFIEQWRKERIILYRKKVRLFGDKFQRVYRNFSINALNDIMRFNVINYISKMDDPQQSLYVLEEDGYRKIDGQRVYHLNMVTVYTMDEQDVYKRFRIILNRDGIKHIEHITEGIVEKVGAVEKGDPMIYW
ncbi:MAG: hypothetical protein CSYNP_01633 [Syntrophus sp. SKADARSKE-3]|nr:hypothetical protein [Syntrophus sp. SKADARSKE-3]